MTRIQITKHGRDHVDVGSDPAYGGAIAFAHDNQGTTLSVTNSSYLYLQSGDNTEIVNNGTNGILILDTGDLGVTVNASGTGSFLTLEATGGSSGGLNITNNGSSGMSISDSGGGNLSIQENGSGDVLIRNAGTGDIALTATTAGSGILLSADSPIILTAAGGTTSNTIQARVSAGNFFAVTDQTPTVRFTVRADGRVNCASLPTSSAGLVSGDLWNSAGTVKIV